MVNDPNIIFFHCWHYKFLFTTLAHYCGKEGQILHMENQLPYIHVCMQLEAVTFNRMGIGLPQDITCAQSMIDMFFITSFPNTKE